MTIFLSIKEAVTHEMPKLQRKVYPQDLEPKVLQPCMSAKLSWRQRSQFKALAFHVP
jgi:hypothetical protein